MTRTTFSSVEKTRWMAPFCAAAVFLVFFCLYLLSASHSVILDHDDAAEFQTIAVVGGLPHQPYPLWCVLARTFALVPISEPAVRATLLSITFAALTLAIFFLFVLRRDGDVVVAAAVTAALGLSLTFWQQATIPEIYSMNAFLFGVVLWAAVRFRGKPSLSRWSCFVLALGFLLSHHQTNIAVLPGVALITYGPVRDMIRREGGTKTLSATVFTFLLPFTLYLYTYVVDRAAYPLNWIDNYGRYLFLDRGGDPSGLDSFFERMRFQMFSPRAIGFPSPPKLLREILVWCRLVVGWEFPLLASVLALVGFVSLCRENLRANLIGVAIVLPYVAIAIVAWGGAGMQKYSMPVYVVLALYIARGLVFFRKTIGRWRKLSSIALVVLGALLIVLPIWRYRAYPPLDGPWQSRFINLQASNDNGQLYGERVSALVPPKSIVFGQWNHVNVLFYFQHVKGALAGVGVYYVLPRKEYMLDIIRRENPSRVYFTYPPEKSGFVAGEEVPVMAGLSLYEMAASNGDP